MNFDITIIKQDGTKEKYWCLPLASVNDLINEAIINHWKYYIYSAY